jgi:hypothetical protein
MLVWPLTDLLKKHSIFHWNEDHEVTFQTFKQALLSTLVLALPDFLKTFCIESDA